MSVLAAEIAERLYEEPTFGHVKMEKMLFLTERLCHIDISSNYHRDAAGPYDNRALRSIDSQLKSRSGLRCYGQRKGTDMCQCKTVANIKRILINTFLPFCPHSIKLLIRSRRKTKSGVKLLPRSIAHGKICCIATSLSLMPTS